ncbi:MAG: hypothetical protein M0Z30_04310 [Actinomycetota bacterium]|nr:hypothetical protein [Actinomycetota bacterium]
MSITELLNDPGRRDHASMPEMDALVDADALQEADLVDVRFDAGSSSVALLLDLRTALQFRLANTAVLVLRDVKELYWAADEPQGARRIAHYIMSSKPGVDLNRFALEVVCLRGWRFRATGLTAEFYVGDVPGLPEAPPNFAEDDWQAITVGMASWDSLFKPGWATFLDPVDPEPI